MAHRFMSLPFFLWEVQNAYSFQKHSSPIFSFLGANWVLQLHHYSCLRGQFIQITLKRISPECKNPFTQFGVSTSLALGKNKLCCDNKIIFFRPSEWRVWEQSTNDIQKSVPTSTLTFFFSIKPQVNISSVLDNNIDKEVKPFGGRADTDSLHEDLGNMFTHCVKADVIFNCRGELIYAHRAILSSRSLVFATMLQEESQGNPIHINDTEPSIFLLFLRYFYTGDLPPVPLDSAMKIYFLAHKYEMEILRRNTMFFMMDNLNVGNSEESSDENPLATKIRRHLRNIKRVVCVGSMKHVEEEKLKISVEAFHHLVKDLYNEINPVAEISREDVNTGEEISSELFNTIEEIDISLVKQEVESKDIKL